MRGAAILLSSAALSAAANINASVKSSKVPTIGSTLCCWSGPRWDIRLPDRALRDGAGGGEAAGLHAPHTVHRQGGVRLHGDPVRGDHGRGEQVGQTIPKSHHTTLSCRFAPPKPKGPLNDGQDAFDASYLNYLLDWWDHVCPQPGLGLTGQFENPLLAMWAAEHPETVKMLRTSIFFTNSL